MSWKWRELHFSRFVFGRYYVIWLCITEGKIRTMSTNIGSFYSPRNVNAYLTPILFWTHIRVPYLLLLLSILISHTTKRPDRKGSEGRLGVWPSVPHAFGLFSRLSLESYRGGRGSPFHGSNKRSPPLLVASVPLRETIFQKKQQPTNQSTNCALKSWESLTTRLVSVTCQPTMN